MHISADYVNECEKFLFQMKALQKRVQKDVNRFIVPQVVPEIYAKTKVSKTARCVFLLLTVDLTLKDLVVSHNRPFTASLDTLKKSKKLQSIIFTVFLTYPSYHNVF